MIGETISRYRIVSHLGSGAMGDVYRADDLRLGRPVALKLIRATGDAHQASRRLLAEARAASVLTHPNIAVVYEVDEINDEGARIGFIAMEYVSGTTLATRAAREPLSIDLILDVGRQIAGALADAHAHGLVHRDIKPSNVMLTDSDRVKVLDFGLARSIAPVDAERSTRTANTFASGADVAGTLPYMSPEQALGRPLDGRSDMFSLGVLLYELVAGRRPFEGDNAVQLIEAVLHGEIPPLVAQRDDARIPAVEGVLRRMLDKNPGGRYDDLRAVDLALAAIQRGEPPAPAIVPTGLPILAVADFVNISANAGDDWLGTGIAETLSADLRGFEGMTVVPRGRVHELVRTLADRGEGGATLATRAGRELGARWVLTGSFQRAGDAVRVTASLLDVASGEVARTVKVDGRMTGIFALQDQLVRDLADGLRAVTRPQETTPDTGIIGAYEAFSKGMINLRTETYESLDRAVLLFERAVDLDPRYARAHLELGVTYATKADYLGMGVLRQRAIESLRRAIDLQPTLVRAWERLGTALIALGQESAGFDAIGRALELEPTDAGAISAMGRALFIGRAEFAEAATWFERGLKENPNAGWYELQLAHCAALLRDFERGESAARRAIALQEAFLSGQEGVQIVGASMRLGHLEALQGRFADALDHFSHEIDTLMGVEHALRSRIIVELNMRLGAAALALGQSRKAQKALDIAIHAFDQRVRLGADEPFTRYYAAAAHALQGDADTALAFLEGAAAELRAFTLERARIEPEFDGLRRDERFQRLLASA
jgi:serine/threonine protein kinase/tetratricopeptide (TPR) repeat protein